MSFSDLLKRPLPSKDQTMAMENTDEVPDDTENMETDDNVIGKDGQPMNVRGNVDEACRGGSGYRSTTVNEEGEFDDDCDDNDYDSSEDDNESLDDFDISGLTDAELDDLEHELIESDIDDAAGDVDSVELDAEEEREADDLMSLTATTELVRDELNVEERAAFFENAYETQVAVYEGFLLESDIRPETDSSVLTEAKMYNKTTVRFSKEDRKAQLYAVAINVSARAHNDPDYVKYQKILRLKRVYKKKLQKKYHNEAIKRMKVYFNRLKSSKSTVLSSIGKKISKDTK